MPLSPTTKRQGIRTHCPLLATALVAVMLSGLAWADALKASRFYEQALGHFDRADYQSAVIQLKNALKEDPNHLPARQLIAKAYQAQGNFPAAVEAYRYALERGADKTIVLVPMLRAQVAQRDFQGVIEFTPDTGLPPEVTMGILVAQGEAYLGLGDWGRADALFVKASLLQPTDASPILGRARVQLAKGDVAAADRLIERGLRLDPTLADAWFLKGETRRLAANLSAAVDFYARAVDLDRASVRARIHRAAALLDLRRDEAAIADIDHVLDGSPDHPQANYLKALYLARTGDMEGARAVLSAAAAVLDTLDTKFMQGHAPSLLLAGVIAFNAGNPEEARRHLETYLKQDSHHSGARKLLGSLLLRAGETEKAIDTLEPAVRRSPNDAALLAVLGSAYQRAQRHNKAAEMFERALRLDPEQDAYQTRLGLARIAMGLEGQGMLDLQGAVRDGDGSPQATLLLGQLHLKRGDAAQALTLARRVIQERPDNPLGHHLAGLAELRQGNTQAAAEYFRKALGVEPTFLAAEYGLAAIHRGLGETAMARERYQSILDRHPREIRAMLELSTLAQADGRLDEAIEWLEKARSMDPDAEPPQIRLIAVLLEAGRPREAEELAQGLGALAPDNSTVLESLAHTQMALKRNDLARNSLRRASRAAAGSPRLLTRIGKLQALVKDGAGARQTLTRAVESDPDDLAARAALVRLEVRLGQLQDAMDQAEQTRRRHPRSAAGDVLLGEALLAAKRYPEALAAYTAANDKDPGEVTEIGLFHARWGTGDRQGAVEALARWSAANPEAPTARKVVAQGYLDLEDYGRARPLYEALTESQPEDGGLLNDLAWIYHQQGDPRALETAEHALRLAPERAAVLDTLGWLLVQRGNPERGMRYLREAQVRAAREPVVRYHLGVALDRLGRKDDAREELEAALAISTSFTGAEDARKLLARLRGG